MEVFADDVDTSIDVKVKLNPNDDTTSVVTDPVDNPLLDAIGLSGECVVCKVTENIVGLDSKGPLVNVVPENKENHGEKKKRSHGNIKIFTPL